MAGTLVVNEVFLSLQGESTFAGLPCVFIRLTGCNLRCSYCDTAYAFTEGRKRAVSEILTEVQRLAAPFSRRSERAGKASLAPHPPSGIPHPVSGLRYPASNLRPPISQEELLQDGSCRLPLVELTGGEPLLQPNALPLMKSLCDDGFTVLLETSGALDIAPVDPRVRRIMDLKCPSSGEVERNRWGNLPHLRSTDEIKFVIGTREDYDWSKRQIIEHNLAARCPLLFSWVTPLTPQQQDLSLKPVPPGQTPITRRQLAEWILADALPVRFQLQVHKFIWPPDQRGV
jgi:7-carboxy-7-deazaguanine synthase